MPSPGELNSLGVCEHRLAVTATKAEALDSYAHTYNDNAAGFASLRTDYPEVKIRTFPPAILTALKAANRKLLDATAAKDPLFNDILDSRRAYLAKVRPWPIISNYDYLKDNQEKWRKILSAE